MIHIDIIKHAMNPIELDKDFYSIKQVTEILQLSRLTIYRYIDQGKLKTHKFGKAHRIKKEDFEDFLEAHKQ